MLLRVPLCVLSSQVLFEILVIVIQLFVASVYAGSLRKKVFTKEFFEKNFPELKGDFPRGGYPDMGTGKYSQKLPLDQWQGQCPAQRTRGGVCNDARVEAALNPKSSRSLIRPASPCRCFLLSFQPASARSFELR